MGNSNSGRWGGKAKCENCPTIDIRRLTREKLLKPTNTFVWRWSDGSTVSAKVHDHGLELRYATNLKPMQSYWFNFMQTDCNYGGTRSWFICPHCENKCAKLYLRNARFACRTCQRLRYNSQALDPLARRQWAHTKLQNRLGDHELRPKGMHWKTYYRLINELFERDNQINQAFELMVMRFTKRCGMSPT